MIGAVVDGETRVVPVKAELENAGGQLKPGMFAELEVLTDKTSAALVVIPASAVVEGNGKALVYVQNGENFEPVEVTLGQTSGDWVEIKTGIFEGDRIVTQGAIALYAQSLRGGNKGAGKQKSEDAPTQQVPLNPSSLPWWWAIPASGMIAAGAFWMGRRTQSSRGAAELPASQIEEFSDLPVLATNHHHHPSVAGKE